MDDLSLVLTSPKSYLIRFVIVSVLNHTCVYAYIFAKEQVYRRHAAYTRTFIHPYLLTVILNTFFTVTRVHFFFAFVILFLSI